MSKKTPNRNNVILPQQRMVEADDAEKQLFADIEQTLKQTRATLQNRSNAAYDGILGSLPEDWPEKDRIEFEVARNEVLAKYSHADALKHLKEYPKHFSREYDGRLLMPLSILKPIATLHYYYGAMKKRPEQGLEKIVGSTIAGYAQAGKKHIKTQSDKAKRPRGKVTKNKTINQIIGEIVLSEENNLEGASALWSPFFDRLNGLGLEPVEKLHPTDVNKSKIEYSDYQKRRKTIALGTFVKVASLYKSGKKSLP